MIGDLVGPLAVTFKVLLVLVGVKALTLLYFSARHERRQRSGTPLRDADAAPTVSVIVPSFNEGPTLAHSIESLLTQSLAPTQIVIVDDGSTDGTPEVARRLADRHDVVTVVHQANGGKAAALNTGLRHSTGDVVVCMDADSALDRDAIAWLAGHFAEDDAVVAVGGNVKVINRRGVLGLHQAVEYVSGLNLQRRCFASIGAMQVISGALGAFRRTALRAVGGFSDDTIVEDMDVTVALGLAGGDVRYEARAVAYTEAPETVRGFLRQRHRWTAGGFQVLRKYREALFDRRSPLGTVGLPYFLIFPWFDVAVSTLFLATIVLAILSGAWLAFAIYYLALSAVSALLVVHCVRIDGAEHYRLAATPLLEGLWYMHLINFVTVWSAIDFVRGSSIRWTELERKGRNGMDVGRPAAGREDDQVIDLTAEHTRERERRTQDAVSR